MTFGGYIRALRMRRGLTLADVGGVLGMNVSGVAKWERGVTTMSVPNLTALLDLLEATPEERLEALRLAAHSSPVMEPTRQGPLFIPAEGAA